MSMIMQLKQLSNDEVAALEKDRTKLEKAITAGALGQIDQARELYRKQGIESMDMLLEAHPYMRSFGPELLAEMEKMFFSKPKKSRKGPPVLSLEKSWHAIHYLLSGEIWTGDTPLGKVLMGGREIGDDSFDTGYGKPRYHDPENVKQMSEDLPTLDELKAVFDPSKISDAGIYSFNKDNADEEWDDLSHFYTQMVDYFRDGAERGNGMLLFVT